jgi:hypothetical protein
MRHLAMMMIALPSRAARALQVAALCANSRTKLQQVGGALASHQKTRAVEGPASECCWTSNTLDVGITFVQGIQVHSAFRFTPHSLNAFKQAARDLQRTYNWKYQQSQEILAKLYGYTGFNALRTHVVKGGQPTLRPFPEEFGALIASPMFATLRLTELAGPLDQLGKMSAEDLALFEHPEVRKVVMANARADVGNVEHS